MLKDWGLVSFQGTKFKRVYTGHFHSRQTIDDHVFYPGSPIPFKHDEGNVPHGFYILDTETMEHKFVNIWKAGKRFFPNETPPAQYCSVVDTDIDNLNAEEIEYNNIRIATSEDVSPEKRQEIAKTLKEKGAADITWMILKNDTAEIATIENSLSKSDLFEIFLSNDTKGIKDLNVDLLRKLNSEVVRDGDEQYSYTTED
jgi:DNA repair exonuclease SbcCD nuclease subunit